MMSSLAVKIWEKWVVSNVQSKPATTTILVCWVAEIGPFAIARFVSDAYNSNSNFTSQPSELHKCNWQRQGQPMNKVGRFESANLFVKLHQKEPIL